MKNEERNEDMDRFIASDGKCIECNKPMFPPYWEAIRECDLKARAWDELEAGFFNDPRSAQYTNTWMKSKMAELLAPPKPKSKLERLKEFIRENSVTGLPIMSNRVLMDEIDRLEAETPNEDQHDERDATFLEKE